MILNRIQIEGYRALRNPVELTGLGLGIHLIHGPNETGKSTLMSAVARALFDRYNSTDQEIRALRPWGTELAPKITLEFETAGKKFRLEKKFLDQESSSLSEWTGSKFERVADSVKADDRVRGFMRGTAPKSGASGLGNWGMARLLWMTQLPSRMEAPGLDESLRQHLLGTLGSAVLSEAEQKLITQLDKAYDVFYTSAKQSEKKGSPLQEARERLARAEENLTTWKAKWDEVSRLNETALTSQARLGVLESERKALDSQIQELRTKAQVELELEQLLKVKNQELLVLLGKWKALNSSQLEVQNLETQIARHRAQGAILEPKVTELSKSITELEAQLLASAKRLHEASESAATLARDLGQAALVSEAKALAAKKLELASLIETASALERELKAKKEEYASRKRPVDTDLEEVRVLSSERDLLKARIADLGLEVRLTPERSGLELSWSSDGSKVITEAGREIVLKSSDSGELLIPGFGRITVRSGAQDSKGLKDRVIEVEARIRAKFEIFGTESWEAFQALCALTAELKAAGIAQRGALASALGNRFKAVSEIADELARVEALLSKQLSQLGIANAGELGLRENADLHGLSESLAPAKAAHSQALEENTQLESKLRASRLSLEEARQGFESARQGAEVLGRQLESKLSDLGGRERLGRELAEAALEKTGSESEYAALTVRLAPVHLRASVKLKELEAQGEEIARREASARTEMNQAAALLSHAEGQGYYSRLAAAEEERAMAFELVFQRETQARGTKLLRGLAHAKRDRMNANLLEPVESAVVRIFNEVRGTPSTLGARLTLGTDLDQIGVKFAEMPAQGREGDKPGSAALGLDVLSLGTQEQAMFAIRLAFGELLSTRGESPEPQLIVLDDPLVNADPVRQARALALLKKASQHLQILILTARPDDYRMLEPKEYDLAELKA